MRDFTQTATTTDATIIEDNINYPKANGYCHGMASKSFSEGINDQAGHQTFNGVKAKS